MYTGSAAFQTRNAQAIQKHRISGTIGGVAFSSADILAGSMTLTRQCSDPSDAQIGAVFVGKLTFTLINDLGIAARSFTGKKITLTFGLLIDDETQTFEYFPLGEFYIAEANVTLAGVVITAYDCMTSFDMALPDNFVISGSVYSVAMRLCSVCGVTYGLTEAQTNLLPNGDKTIGLYTPNDCVTYRDVLYWLSQTVGGFATIDRTGKLILFTYGTAGFEPPQQNANRRVNDASFSDYITDFGAARFLDEEGYTETIGSPGIGVTYDCGFNPFMQYGTSAVKLQMRQAVLGALLNIKYMPYKINVLSAPIYDLGDELAFWDGIVSSRQWTGVVHKITYTVGKGVTLEGFGANPALQGAKKPNDGNRAIQQAKEVSEVVTKRYENAVEFEIDSTQEQVIQIDFVTTMPTDVEMWHEILLETALTDSSMELEAVYYMDNIELARKPVETYMDDGKHILDLHYSMDVPDIGSHRWEVHLVATGGTATISENGILAVLKGQGIAKAEAWSGVIVLDDSVPLYDIEMLVQEVSDTASASLSDCDVIQVSDSVGLVDIEMETISVSGALNIVLENFRFTLMSENELYFITDEDGVHNLASE